MSIQISHPERSEAKLATFAVRLSKVTERLREFLTGDVDIETGRITGRAALLQIAALPIVVAIGATMMTGSAVWAYNTRAAALD